MDELKNYIEKARQQGINDSKIIEELLAAGWDRPAVELAFRKLQKSNLNIKIIVTLFAALLLGGITYYQYFGKQGNNVVQNKIAKEACPVPDSYQLEFVEGPKYYNVFPLLIHNCKLVYVATVRSTFPDGTEDFVEILVIDDTEITPRYEGRIVDVVTLGNELSYKVETKSGKYFIAGDTSGKEYDSVSNLGVIDNKLVYIGQNITDREETVSGLVKATIIWGDKVVKTYSHDTLVSYTERSIAVKGDELFFTTVNVTVEGFEENIYSINVKTGVQKKITEEGLNDVSKELFQGQPFLEGEHNYETGQGAFFVVYKDNRWGPYDKVEWPILVAGKVMYIVTDYTKYQLIEDGKIIKELSDPLFDLTSVGDSYAYLKGKAGEGDNRFLIETVQVVFNNTESKPYRNLSLYNVRGKLVFIAKQGSGDLVVFDGIELRQYNNIEISKSGVYGNKFVFVVKEGDLSFIVQEKF